MTTVQDILTFMEGLAPYELAESWDNVGLLCGDRAQEVTSVLFFARCDGNGRAGSG